MDLFSSESGGYVIKILNTRIADAQKTLCWTKELIGLKVSVEEKAGETFHSFLLTLYHSSDEGMACHSNAEET